jgi:hypothetical protein
VPLHLTHPTRWVNASALSPFASTQQILGGAANFPEQGRVYRLVQKAVRYGIASGLAAAENGIIVFLDDPVGQKHL